MIGKSQLKGIAKDLPVPPSPRPSPAAARSLYLSSQAVRWPLTLTRIVSPR